MEKLDPQNYKGIKFITLKQLSAGERESLLDWIDRRYIISIQVKNSLLRNCVQYSEYEYWFENIYHKKKPAPAQKNTGSLKKFIKVAFSR